MFKSVKEYLTNVMNCLKNKSLTPENSCKKYDINVSINESVEKKDGNDKSNLLKLEIYGRFLIYGITIGFIYNYTYYNLINKFNIFDFLQPNDLLFSWFGSAKLMQIMFVFLFLYIVAIYYKSVGRLSNLIIFIIAASTYITLFYFSVEKNLSFQEFFKYIDFSSAIQLVILSLIIISLSQFIKPDKEKSDINFIEIVLVIGAFIFTFLNTYLEDYENNKNPTFTYIQYKKTYDEKKFQDMELIFIGRTSSVSIFKCNGITDTKVKDKYANAIFESTIEEKKYNSFIVLSNDDISNIIIKKEAPPSVSVDKNNK